MKNLEGKLIVSCQAGPEDATYGLMDRFARAAVAGGAAGIRANGPADIRAIRQAVAVPVIGIQKVVHTDGRVLITPSFEAAKACVEAGADAIALDCTGRGRESGAFERLRAIREGLGVPVLADIATLEEARAAAEAGADFILTTMRGYTEETAHMRTLEAAFVRELVSFSPVPVIAEGRIDTPALAQQAMRAGAYAVVVGTAITRPHVTTRWFADAVESASGRCVEALGIDLGGTNTKFGLVTRSGELRWQDTAATPAALGREVLLEHLKRIAREGVERSRRQGQTPAAIGVATAGWVDPGTGRVAYATDNLPGWTGAPIANELRGVTGLPVHVENDANALAVGEHSFGAARGLRDFVCITLGTGVGGGCYTGGALNRGSHFFANALGHVSIEPHGRPCNCGQRGCLEVYANAAALLRYGGDAYADCETLIASANAGDTRAVAAIGELAGRLAEGCAILVHLFDPEALILAGGLTQNNPSLLSFLEGELAQRVNVWSRRKLSIRTSRLGYHAGVLGAAAIAFQARETGA